jgi:hypothetical protein
MINFFKFYFVDHAVGSTVANIHINPTSSPLSDGSGVIN